MSTYQKNRQDYIQKVKKAADEAAANPKNKENLRHLHTVMTEGGVSLKKAGVSKKNQFLLKSKLNGLQNGKEKKNRGNKTNKNGRYFPETKRSHIHTLDRKHV